jgi:tRNA-dihydrouridine synthase B
MPEETNILKDIEFSNLTLRGNILLAPMAGYSDAAFRSLCVDYGASLCFTEMISAEATETSGK